MEDELRGLLGLNKQATQQDILAEVKKMVIDLRGKMGYMSLPLLEKLIRDGYLKRDEQGQVYRGLISFESMDRLLKKS